MRRALGTLLALVSLGRPTAAWAQASSAPSASANPPTIAPSAPSAASSTQPAVPVSPVSPSSPENPTGPTPPGTNPSTSAPPNPDPETATSNGATSISLRREPRKPAEPKRERKRPTPLVVDYAQYGLGLGGDINITSGRICPPGAKTPCIIGTGGGLAIRGGYRPSGPWYIGGAYQFSKLDSNNLLLLGVFQQLRGEMRYYVDFGSRFTPYAEWGVGGVAYGNEWGISTGGAMAMLGGGVEFEITRFAVVGTNLAYEPVLFAGYTDATGQKRDTGISQFMRLELCFELRTELGRE